MRRRFRRTPWIFRPFAALWRLVAGLVGMTGRMIGAAVGLVLLVLGALLTATVLGAVVGIPLLFLGGMIVVRSLF